MRPDFLSPRAPVGRSVRPRSVEDVRVGRWHSPDSESIDPPPPALAPVRSVNPCRARVPPSPFSPLCFSNDVPPTYRPCSQKRSLRISDVRCGVRGGRYICTVARWRRRRSRSRDPARVFPAPAAAGGARFPRGALLQTRGNVRMLVKSAFAGGTSHLSVLRVRLDRCSLLSSVECSGD